VQNSFEIFKYLKELGYLKELRDRLWWPNSGTFEVVVGAILTQQTRWDKVEKALANLKEADMLSLEKLSRADHKELAKLIKPSGFYNTKAKRLKWLSQNIIKDFGDFENFKNSVDREWLLSQKGLGKESSDSILCYCCERDVLVVDTYTARLLKNYGYEFEEYDELREWMEEGILSNLDRVYELYEEEKPINEIFARFHGKIVDFSKDKK